MADGMKAESYKKGKKFFIDNMKLLPMARFLPQPTISKGKGKDGKDKGKGKGKDKGKGKKGKKDGMAPEKKAAQHGAKAGEGGGKGKDGKDKGKGKGKDGKDKGKKGKKGKKGGLSEEKKAAKDGAMVESTGE